MIFQNFDQIKTAVQNGSIVCWKTTDYRIVSDLFGHFSIAYRPWSKSPNYVSLFWADGVTTDYTPSEFFIFKQE